MTSSDYIREEQIRLEQELDSPEPLLQPISDESDRRIVLLLEDDLVQLRLLEKHVESLNFQVLAATTIHEAEKLLSENRPNLAIFDINLPDGSGLDLCQKVDQDPRFSNMPIIVMSSNNQPDIVRKTRASGGIYFIGKPYDPNVLFLLIEQALGQSLE